MPLQLRKVAQQAHATLNVHWPVREQPDELVLKVDTGVKRNILTGHIFRRLFPHKLGWCDATAWDLPTSYSGDEIKHYGAVSLWCKHRNETWKNVEFYIADSEGLTILRRPSSNTALCYMNSGIGESQIRKPSLQSSMRSRFDCKPVRGSDNLKKAFPDSSNARGSFKEEYTMTLNLTVPQWSIPNTSSPQRNGRFCTLNCRRLRAYALALSNRA